MNGAKLVFAGLGAIVLLGCGEPALAPDASPIGRADGGASDSGADPSDSGSAPDSRSPREDAGLDAVRDEFLATLDGTVWSALQTRIEGGVEVERAYEVHFQGGGEPMWGEIRNPFGPSRQRVLRFVQIASGGCPNASRCEITTRVSIPVGWETPEPLRGRMETWTIDILDGSPRAIAIRDASGNEEIFTEGAWPAPTRGLTAEVRVFEGGEGNPISDAFCTSGGNLRRRHVLWEFARGESAETTLARDLVAGAELREWIDVENRFGIRDIDGFDVGTLGGSLRTDQFYFVVRYRGVIDHPGGRFQMRERADRLEDGVWVFIGSQVGSSNIDDVFLEVHNFFWPDATDPNPQLDLPAGEVPIEVIVPRCEMLFEDPFELELRTRSDVYQLLEDHPVRPIIDETLFPPVLP